MKTVDPLNDPKLDEASVVHFLEQHSDFFVRHTELLESLTIPHQLDGKVLSILEYQIRLLQQRIAQLTQQCDSVREQELGHRSLMRNLPELIAQLFECPNNFEILKILESFLRTHYHAKWLRVFSNMENASRSDEFRDRIHPLSSDLRGMFTLIFNNPKPLCGSLQHEHITALFGPVADEIHSTLLIPFEFQNNEALLAIGSKNWQGYKQSVTLDLLVIVIEIVSGLSNQNRF